MLNGVDSSLRWAPDGDLETAPESGTGSLQLRFEYEGGAVRLHTPSVRDSVMPQFACRPWLDVDVTVALTSGGGALAERFPATLRAARPGVVSALGSLGRADVMGSLQVTPLRPVTVTGFQLDATMTTLGNYGALRLGVALPADFSADSLEFDLQLSQRVSAGEGTGGELRVTGATDRACGDSSEVDACLAARAQELTRASIGSSM